MPAPLDGKRVFMVEDNLSNRAIMQMILEQNGAKVSFERWGMETVERLRAFAPIDIILMDMMFPNGVTGVQVFEKIRHWGEFDAVPILAVSAGGTGISIPSLVKMGFAGYIGKPVDLHKFPNQVAAVIRKEAIWERS